MGICVSTKDKKENNLEKTESKIQKQQTEKSNKENKIETGGYTSRQEKTEKKSDGTIIKTIIEKKEGEIKTTTITKKGNTTETKTEIEKTEITKTTKSTKKNHNIKNNEISNSNIDSKKNSFEHSNNKYQGKNLGENLFMCQGKSINGYDMSQSWYDEINNYNFKNATFKSGTGHFTQLIWKNSTDVGFGYCKNDKGIYIGVANYFPAGNYMGQFKENVLPA